jgi:diadenosine tetraphosphate (Ap4A) HIT family hydrolase
VEHLNSLSLEAQTLYLRDMALIGRAVEEVTGCKRIMYGIFGGLHPVLHSHIMPRYGWEGEGFKRDVGHAYLHRFEPEYLFSPERHGGLQQRLRVRLLELMVAANVLPE